MKTKKFFFITHPYRTCIKNRRYLRLLKNLAAIGGTDRKKNAENVREKNMSFDSVSGLRQQTA